MDEQRPPEPTGPPAEDPSAADGSLPAPPPEGPARPWQPAPAGPRPAIDPTQKQAGILVLAGGLLVILCQFLPWFTVSGLGLSVSETGMDAHNWGLLLLGAFAAARGASMVRPDLVRVSLGTPLIGGALLAFLMIARYNDLQSAVAQAPTTVDAAIGIGFWGAAVGTALVIVGGLLALRVRR